MINIEGDHIKVTASRYPFPTVCKEDQATDWFNSLQNCLHWNKRERQKSFAVVESHPVRPKNGSSRSGSSQHLSSPRSGGSGSTGYLPISRNGTQSPPAHTHSNARKSSATSSVTSSSSDAGHDEVFGVFCDDDSGSDRYQGKARRCSTCAEDMGNVSDSNDDTSFDSFDSDEDTESLGPEEFNGWTDEEINKARYMARIAKELERVSLKDAKHISPLNEKHKHV